MLSQKGSDVTVESARDSAVMKANKTLIGRITEVTSDFFTARLKTEGGEFQSERMIGMHKVRVGQVGSYMKVSDGNVDVVVMVESLWQQKSSDGRLDHFVRLSPLGELALGGEFKRGVANYPTTGAELHALSTMALERIFSDTADGGYKVGKLSASENTDVFFNASKFLGRHAAILGQTGSGKSWTVTSLIQSALRTMPSAHIIVLDLHGEYGDKDAGVVARSPFPENKVRCLDALNMEIPYWLLGFSEMVELLIDDDDPDAATQQAMLRTAIIDLKRSTNTEADVGQITVDSPVYFDIEELFKMIKDAIDMIITEAPVARTCWNSA